MKIAFKEVQELLQARFVGIRKDGIDHIARSLALLDVKDIDALKEMVNAMDEKEVTESINQWRSLTDSEISKANKTYEEGLKKKFDFKPKGEGNIDNPNPTPQPSDKPTNTPTTQELIAEAIKQATAGFQKEIADIKASSLNDARKVELEKAIGNDVPSAFKQTIMDSFTGRQFADDDAFKAFIEQTKANVSSINKEMADRGLGQMSGKPNFGKTSKDGVSAGVEAYIKSKAESNADGNLQGKAI